MAYLLVHAGNALGAENYGMALVWISPYQVWTSMMEEAVGTLSACTSNGPDWPFILAQLYQASSHTPLPKGKHLGVLLQGKAEESPYGQISQLKVCQLLSAGPWVIYPVGLKGGNQPVPSLCHSSHIAVPALLLMSTLTWGLTFPYFPQRIQSAQLNHQMECTLSPVAAPPKTPWKPRISLATKVNDLLIWAMVSNLSHESWALQDREGSYYWSSCVPIP